MKNFIKHSFLPILVFFFYCSFTFEPDPIYSCDPEINAWVKANKTTFLHFDRKDIVSFKSFEKQKAIYLSLNGEKKCAIWKEKLNIELYGKDMLKDDVLHLKKMIDFMTPSHFESVGNDLALKTFCKEWKKIAIEKLSWSEEKLIRIGYTFMTQDELLKLYNEIRLNSSGSFCNCTMTTYCVVTNQGATCKNGGCIATGSGCGWLLLEPCTGSCGRVQE